MRNTSLLDSCLKIRCARRVERELRFKARDALAFCDTRLARRLHARRLVCAHDAQSKMLGGARESNNYCELDSLTKQR